MTTKNKIRAPKAVSIESDRTYCDGEIGALGHPRVYLTINKVTQQVQCPYCDKCFIKKLK